MIKVNCLIIDDEKNARENLASLIGNYCPHLHVLGKAENATEGMELIAHLRPDAVFLDIHMPDSDGFSLLEKLPHPQLTNIMLSKR